MRPHSEPALSRGEISALALTTPGEYRKSIEKDRVRSSGRFQAVEGSASERG